MRNLCILALGGLLALLALPAAAEPVAIVYSLAGEASLTAPVRRSLRRFDRLPAGTTVEVNPDSRLALAFVNGIRYELGERSRVTIGHKDLVSRAGLVRSLPRVPPLPRLSPIAAEDRPGPKAGAVRIRTEAIKGLHPDQGEVSLPSATRLRFDPVPAAPGYRIRILDQIGETRFQIDTQATEVDVPSGVLEPGERYRWTVETRDRPGGVARGEATLMILDAGRARAREVLRNWVQRSGNEEDRLLQEAVDHALGLSMPGLLVETVAPSSAAFLAGLQPGDRLFSWCVENICRELRTPFDWLDIQMDEVQRGGVVVEGTRGSESLRWKLLPTFQGIAVAPLFHGDLAEVYERLRAGQLHAKARQWPEADAAFESALAQAQALGAAGVESHLRMAWSEAFLQRDDLPRARQQLERALRLEENDHPESLGVATVLLRLGNVIERQDDLDEAERLYRRAHGLILRLAPGSGGEAAAANNLSVISGRRGDLAEGEPYAARALAIREKLTPDSDAIIPALLNYGVLVYARGDFAGAEAVFLRARGILEKLPAGVPLAKTLHNLGELAVERGDQESAEDLFKRELALFERIDPGGTQVLDSLVGLGEVALRQGQGTKAEPWLKSALALSGKLNPAGPKNARCLHGLAEAARLQGRLAEAEGFLGRALSIWQKINPESAQAGSIHLSLGLLRFEQGNAGAAEPHLRTAIRIYEQDRRPLPEGYQALARLQARKGQGEEAAASYLSAIDALEIQKTRLGGARESQWLYGSALGDLYFEAAEHQIALKRPQEAWQLVERGRARGFQELLAQRDLRFAGELPAELYAERRRLAAEYDRVQAALADWAPEHGLEKMAELQGRLRDLRLEQAEVQEKVRRSSPRIQALESPALLDLKAARSSLDPGTVLITYAVGEKRSFLFVIHAEGTPGPGLTFHPLAIGEEDLEKEVEGFRSLLGQPESLLASLKRRGAHLYDILIRPAEPVLAKADRWLISPDGPLHSLPFAALLSGDRYLAESKPVHIVASAAVYKEIKAARSTRASAATELLALGDPLYPKTATDPQAQDVLRRGFRLDPLPATRTEVGAISRLYPTAQILLGRDATEEAIKSLAPQSRRLHFACHGLLDERFPLNSALALSAPEQPQEGRDNGLLQAWEVLEELRLNADLVTLSACDSGLGKEMGGEGLVGLVRAFQFAGARSVLASLWSVADDSTADLMRRFYSYLRDGQSKDEALRKAQADLIRSQGFSHPYHWAAFQLTGDWR